MRNTIGMWYCGGNIDKAGCVCSECGYLADKRLVKDNLLDECPQCGAKMLKGIYDIFPCSNYKEMRK